MAKIDIQQTEGTWVVRAGGAVLGESSAALELSEDGLAPVIYFPRSAIAMAFFDPSDTSTTCPHKGTASYFTLHTKSTVIPDAAWSYENPNAEVAAIKEHLAFDTEKVTVERI
ncbi:MAG TPA: DUF427 domain-containing protein [Aliiroseovarius sp.]|nr:DUF427 domain-containing protein [Aliiroseovarius sp.]